MGKERTKKALTLLVVGTTLAAGVVVATSTAAKPSEPGGTLVASGQLVDNKGQSFEFELQAEESSEPGRGDMFFHLGGPFISVCDAHGPSAEPGSTPLAGMQCGGTSSVSVVVDDCTALLETHGIVHADHPWTVYLGPMTVDIKFVYHPAKARGDLSVEIYTPKDVITIRGTTSGPVVMDTCS